MSFIGIPNAEGSSRAFMANCDTFIAGAVGLRVNIPGVPTKYRKSVLAKEAICGACACLWRSVGPVSVFANCIVPARGVRPYTRRAVKAMLLAYKALVNFRT